MQSFSGKVRPGQGRGEKLGAPTANFDVALADFPKGLYHCEVVWGEKTLPGLLYYGINSLTGKDCLEAHLLDFSGDLNGQELTVRVRDFIRPEIKFSREEDMASQIKKDLAEAKRYSERTGA